MNRFEVLKNATENRIDRIFNNLSLPEEIKEAMYYSLSVGGKRLRPVLLLMFASLNGDYTDSALDYAAAIEMIHTYSLIHDDLPAMDNDDLRRGMPSNHKKFGEAMAILAGDGLLSLAVQIMSSRCLEDSSSVYALNDIIIGAGVSGMIAGQAMDIVTERGQARYEVECIDRAKTGALIKASCLAGARFSQLDSDEIEIVGEFADELGLAFQITDDILDVIGSTDLLGKSVGSDDKNEKMTYVTVYGLEGAKHLAKKSIENALELLHSLNKNTIFIEQLTRGILKRDH